MYINQENDLEILNKDYDWDNIKPFHWKTMIYNNVESINPFISYMKYSVAEF